MLNNTDRFLIRALREQSEERGIEMSTFSTDWIVHLQKGESTQHVFGYHFPLNCAPATMLAGDKAAASGALAAAGVPCVDHRLFLRPDLSGYTGATGNWDSIAAYAEEHNWNLVAKPNEGTGGSGVSLVRSKLELETAVHDLFCKHRSLSLSPFHQASREVRLVMLDGICRLAYEKVRFDPDVEWRHNLALGATPTLLKETGLVSALSQIARNAMNSLGLRFASIDIIEVEEEWSVLEANAGVMMESFARQGEQEAATASSIYGAALDAIFT